MREARSVRFGTRVMAAVVVLAAVSVVVATGPVAQAAPDTRTWVGGTGNLWSTPQNWSPEGPPQDGDALMFPQSPNTWAVDDIPLLTLASISFSGSSSYAIGRTNGAVVTLTGGISSDSTVWNIEFHPSVVLSAGIHDVQVSDQGSHLGFYSFVSGAGGIRKLGTGGATLLAPNTYEGQTLVEAGMLSVGTLSGLGSAAQGTVVSDGATLGIADSLNTQDPVAEPLTLQGPGWDGVGALNTGANLTISGPVELVGTETTILLQHDAVVKMTGGVSGTARLRKMGDGKLWLPGPNTFEGGSRVERGMILVSHANALGPGAVEVVGGATLQVTDNISLPNALAVSGAPVFGAITSVGDNTLEGALTMSGTTSISVDEVGTLVIASPLGGAGTLIKDGWGALLLLAPSTFGGATTVQAGVLVPAAAGGPALPGDVDILPNGTLVLGDDEQLVPSADVTVRPGGVLDAFGSSASFGQLSAESDVFLGVSDPQGGNAFSNVRLTGLSLAGGSLSVVVGGSSPGAHDQFQVNGPISVGTALDVTVASLPPVGSSIVLVVNDGTDAVNGTFWSADWSEELNEGAVFEAGGARFQISYRGGTGNDVTLKRLADVVSTPPPQPIANPGPATPRSGYWMVGRTGNVYAFGDAGSFGNAPVGPTPAVDLEPTPSGNGYWVVDEVGHVFTFGDAGYKGAINGEGLAPGERVTSLSSTAPGGGYWIFTSRGRVVPFGDAAFYGDMSGTALNGPVLDSIPTPSGKGYFMVASDGGIFSFGDAKFRGSMGDSRLNAPVQSLVPDPDGDGYWLVASDGGIFAFAAGFHGSMGGSHLNKPITGMVAYGEGYLMVAEDGGIFSFSNKPFAGSLGANPPANPIVSVAALD